MLPESKVLSYTRRPLVAPVVVVIPLYHELYALQTKVELDAVGYVQLASFLFCGNGKFPVGAPPLGNEHDGAGAIELELVLAPVLALDVEPELPDALEADPPWLELLAPPATEPVEVELLSEALDALPLELPPPEAFDCAAQP